MISSSNWNRLDYFVQIISRINQQLSSICSKSRTNKFSYKIMAQTTKSMDRRINGSATRQGCTGRSIGCKVHVKSQNHHQISSNIPGKMLMPKIIANMQCKHSIFGEFCLTCRTRKWIQKGRHISKIADLLNEPRSNNQQMTVVLQRGANSHSSEDVLWKRHEMISNNQ
jgi:hypothetical protein